MTDTSSHTAEHERAVLRSEAQTVAEGRVDLRGPGRVRDEVHVARRVLILEIDGGRQQAPRHAHRRCRQSPTLPRTLPYR